MKISMISFSRTGYGLSEKVYDALKKQGYEVYLYTKSMYTKKIMDESQLDDTDRSFREVTQFAEPVDMSIKEWAGMRFQDSDAIIFIGACGIAVRSISPFIKDVHRDPAVVVVDEQGKFVISLLSGHVGGANKLTEEISHIVEGVPVITTAKDTDNQFAVDTFARKNKCFTSDLELAKEISAALVNGEKIGFTSDFPWIGEIPAGLVYLDGEEEKPEIGIYITNSYEKHPFLHTLYLIPRVITVGVECEKGTNGAIVEKVIRKACDEHLIPSVAMECVVSLDQMKGEEGIQKYCQERNLPFITYSVKELEATQGTFPKMKESCKMEDLTCLCERCAVLGNNEKKGDIKNHLILRKYEEDGVCVALAKCKWSVNF